MKTILAIFFGCFFALSLSAQSGVTARYSPPIYNPSPNESQSTQNAVGYCYNNQTNNTKRVKLKISISNNYGITQLVVVAAHDSQYNTWVDCHNVATQVQAYIDGQTIADNFTWKVNTVHFGTIYFNFD